jgi:hypothetical protein
MFIITFFDSDNDATLESSVLRALLSGVLLLVTPFSGLDGASGVERDRLDVWRPIYCDCLVPCRGFSVIHVVICERAKRASLLLSNNQ